MNNLTTNEYCYFNKFASAVSMFEAFSEFLQTERITDTTSNSYIDVMSQMQAKKSREEGHEQLHI